MPMIRTGRGILYFAHVPKCAGTAIEGYLTWRFGARTRALLDPGHMSVPPRARWSHSSPQHIDTQSLIRLFPGMFFDHMFATVRHPAERLRSVYLHQRDIEEKIDPSEDFPTWLRQLPARRAADPWYLDNHARPMGDIVPEGCTVFRLEQGTDQIVRWIDAFMGNENDPRKIDKTHSYKNRLTQVGKRPLGKTYPVAAEDLAFIYQIDRADYERFGYAIDPSELTEQGA